MLIQIKQIIDHMIPLPLNVEVLRERYGKSISLRTPAEVFDIVQAYCHLAMPQLIEKKVGIAEQGAGLLIRFIALMPEHLVASIRAVPSLVAGAERAWIEPNMNAFIALACTVQDVWAHLLGPESEEDDAISEVIMWHKPRNVYDFGCGSGHFSHLLASTGVEVDAFEIDPMKKAFFLFRAKESGLEHHMRLGQRRECYDLVLALNVFDHMEDALPSIAYLESLLPQVGILCTIAAFPQDNWHQSNPAVVSSCADALWSSFTLSKCSTAQVSWMDCWERRVGPKLSASISLHPCLNPGTTLLTERDGREIILHANRFYSLPVTVDSYTAEICEQFDGVSSISEIAAQKCIDPEELLELCELLQKHGHLFWRTNHFPI